MNLEERLGIHLRLLRRSAGLTQAEVATAAGMDRTQYAHIEAGRNSVASSRLKPLADALGVTVAELVARAWDEPTADPPSEPGLNLMWAFGPHTLRLETVRTSEEDLARVRCTCAEGMVWHRHIDGRDPLGSLIIRSDSTLVDAIARHLDSAGERSGGVLKTEAFLAALSSGTEALWLLDRFSDRSWMERDGHVV